MEYLVIVDNGNVEHILMPINYTDALGEFRNACRQPETFSASLRINGKEMKYFEREGV